MALAIAPEELPNTLWTWCGVNSLSGWARNWSRTRSRVRQDSSGHGKAPNLLICAQLTANGY
jgi:hypothetical protein